MADTSFSSNIVIDAHALMSLTRVIKNRIAPQAYPFGPNMRDLLEHLRLLFVDTGQGLFVFGAPDDTTRIRTNLHARAALEKALAEIFEGRVRVEVVVFDENDTTLADLVAGFAKKPAGPGQDGAGADVTLSPDETEPLVDAVLLEAPGDAGRRLSQVQLEWLQASLRDVFTSPKRVVVVPGYLLRWLPYIGPLRTSIVAACFQAFYHAKGTTARANQSFEAPGPFLAALAGVAESSIWRHLDDPELGWFLKKAPYKPGEKQWLRDEKAGLTKRRPTRFLFRSISPLTPGDADALRSYLLDLEIQENPLEVLTDLVKGEYRLEPRDVFPFPASPPPEDWRERNPETCLIHPIIYSSIEIEPHNATKELADLVDGLVERLLPSNDQLHISWYYLLHWLPLLGHGPGWATLLMRDRCFYNRQTGELRDTVTIKHGYQELADALGLQRVKTVREWFPAPHAQQEQVKYADLSSAQSLEQISQSKRSFVREYAARFVGILDAEADGRGKVSSLKAQVRLFDPLIPSHEAVYTALFPLAQFFFSLPQEARAAFLGTFDTADSAQPGAIERITHQAGRAVEEIGQRHSLAIQAGQACVFEEAVIRDFLGAIESITEPYLGVNGRITEQFPGAVESVTDADPGAFEQIKEVDPGAIGRTKTPDLGEFGSFAALLSGALERLTMGDLGALERLGLVFWAYMRGLKYMVLNTDLNQALRGYFQNTDIKNTQKLISTTTGDDQNGNQVGEVEVDSYNDFWDLGKLLDNFSPHVKRGLLEKGVTVEALLSCLLYLASSKGDNLGLGYVVEKLKVHPQEGQGGIYRRLAGESPEEIVDRLRRYIDNRSFRDRDWRVAMGTPSTEKIFELLEHLGIDTSKIGANWE